MTKITLTILLTLMTLTSFGFSNAVEARGFICEVCSQGFDIRIGDSNQDIGRCVDGYNHFFTPTGNSFLEVAPKEYFEETVKNMQGTWTDDNGNTITVQGRYLNGNLMRAIAISMNVPNYTDRMYSLILQEEKTISKEFEINSKNVQQYIKLNGIVYYKKYDYHYH